MRAVSTCALFGLQILFASTLVEAFTKTLSSRHSSSRHSVDSLSSLSAVNFQLNPDETAFVWIEYQNEFTTKGGKFHDVVQAVMAETGMLENSSRLADFARDRGCTIIHVPISFGEGHKEIAVNPYGILAGIKDGEAFTAGEWGAGFSDQMTPKLGDLIAKGKSGLCGFATTNLDFLLRQSQTKNVVLGGFLTNCCVESTMRTAYELGYTVFTLTDCVATTSKAAQDATIEHNFGMFSNRVTSKVAMEAIESAVSTFTADNIL